MTDDDRSYIGIAALLIIASLGGGAAHPLLGAAILILGFLAIVLYAAAATVADKVRRVGEARRKQEAVAYEAADRARRDAENAAIRAKSEAWYAKSPEEREQARIQWEEERLRKDRAARETAAPNQDWEPPGERALRLLVVGGMLLAMVAAVVIVAVK